MTATAFTDLKQHLLATNHIYAAALTFRCPEGAEALHAALGITDDSEAIVKLDAAFKAIARAEFAAEVAA